VPRLYAADDVNQAIDMNPDALLGLFDWAVVLREKKIADLQLMKLRIRPNQIVHVLHALILCPASTGLGSL
jgi:hypothetical protein